MRGAHVLATLVFALGAGCIEVPSLPACLSSSDCAPGLVCGQSGACEPIDVGVDADLGPHETSATCTPTGAEFVVPPVTYPAATADARHVAVAGTGAGRYAVAWTDPRADCGAACTCPDTADAACPPCTPCAAPDEEGVHLACLGADFDRPPGAPLADWSRAAAGVTATYVPGRHQLHLTWVPRLSRYILTWAETDWTDHTLERTRGPGAIGVALFDVDCRPVGEAHIITPATCGPRGALHDPRVWWDVDDARQCDADGAADSGGRFRLIAADAEGEVCVSTAAELDALRCDPVTEWPCPANRLFDRPTFVGGTGFDWALVRWLDGGPERIQQRRVQYACGALHPTQRLVDPSDPRPPDARYDGVVARFTPDAPWRFASVAAAATPPGPDSADDGGMAVAWVACAGDCDAAHEDRPVFVQHFATRLLESGQASNGRLDALPGDHQGAALRLAGASAASPPIAVAHDPGPDLIYVTRPRADGIWLSVVERAAPAAGAAPEAPLNSRGACRVGPGQRSRVAAGTGEALVVVVDDDGTIRARRHAPPL